MQRTLAPITWKGTTDLAPHSLHSTSTSSSAYSSGCVIPHWTTWQAQHWHQTHHRGLGDLGVHAPVQLGQIAHGLVAGGTRVHVPRGDQLLKTVPGADE